MILNQVHPGLGLVWQDILPFLADKPLDELPRVMQTGAV